MTWRALVTDGRSLDAGVMAGGDWMLAVARSPLSCVANGPCATPLPEISRSRAGATQYTNARLAWTDPTLRVVQVSAFAASRHVSRPSVHTLSLPCWLSALHQGGPWPPSLGSTGAPLSEPGRADRWLGLGSTPGGVPPALAERLIPA